MPEKVRIRASIPEDYAIALQALADLKGVDFSDLVADMAERELKKHGYLPERKQPEITPEQLAAEVERRRKQK